jgi:hypothetical protein
MVAVSLIYWTTICYPFHTNKWLKDSRSLNFLLKSQFSACYTQLIKLLDAKFNINCCHTLSQFSLSARESKRRLSFCGISFSICFKSSIRSASGQSGISETNTILHYSGAIRCWRQAVHYFNGVNIAWTWSHQLHVAISWTALFYHNSQHTSTAITLWTQHTGRCCYQKQVAVMHITGANRIFLKIHTLLFSTRYLR